MALLNISMVALLFAGYLIVNADAVAMCQLCMTTPGTLNLTVGNVLSWNTIIAKEGPELGLCVSNIAMIIRNYSPAEMMIRAFLQVLVQNPYKCYFTFNFGATASPVGCLVSGYKIPGHDFTQGSCEAMGKLAAGDILSVTVGSAQGDRPCVLDTNSFVCLSATEISP